MNIPFEWWSALALSAAGSAFTIVGGLISHLMERGREARLFASQRRERNDGFRRAKLEQLYKEVLAFQRLVGEIEKQFFYGETNAVDPERLDVSGLGLIVDMYVPSAEPAFDAFAAAAGDLASQVRPILGGASRITDPLQLEPFTEGVRKRAAELQAAIAREARRILLDPR